MPTTIYDPSYTMTIGGGGVTLQAGSPGVQEVGNLNINGTAICATVQATTGTITTVNSTTVNGTTLDGTSVIADKFYVSSLNTAPLNAGDVGTAGEIRFTSGAIYVCVALNTWKKVDIAAW